MFGPHRTDTDNDAIRQTWREILGTVHHKYPDYTESGSQSPASSTVRRQRSRK